MVEKSSASSKLRREKSGVVVPELRQQNTFAVRVQKSYWRLKSLSAAVGNVW